MRTLFQGEFYLRADTSLGKARIQFKDAGGKRHVHNNCVMKVQSVGRGIFDSQ